MAYINCRKCQQLRKNLTTEAKLPTGNVTPLEMTLFLSKALLGMMIYHTAVMKRTFFVSLKVMNQSRYILQKPLSYTCDYAVIILIKKMTVLLKVAILFGLYI